MNLKITTSKPRINTGRHGFRRAKGVFYLKGKILKCHFYPRVCFPVAIVIQTVFSGLDANCNN